MAPRERYARLSGSESAQVWPKAAKRTRAGVEHRKPQGSLGPHSFIQIRQGRHNVKKVKITIHGRMIHSAHRSFEIGVPDDENVQLYDMNAVSDLADDAKAVWQVDREGYVLEDDHTIDSVTDAEESSPATLDSTDPRIARICSIFGIDPNDPGLGDEPTVSF